jgi:amidase/aspartyl-tRNA(Asn)/glutamyl-tRNA(Gln) amidotransferase subunit A
MRELLESTIAELGRAFARGAASPVEVVRATLERVERANPALNALWSVRAEAALDAARAAEQRWRRGAPLGPLDGIPVTIKDSVHKRGWPWRHGTAANADRPDSGFDAPPAARLEEAGAVTFAKTTMPDFGLLASGVSSAFGIVRNPWAPAMSPGGSSAGAGASLAAGIGLASVGSDIAGSVRLPASHCGLVALKPTQGRIPHLAPSPIRSAGPLARSVADAATLFSVLARPDPRDTLSLPPEPEPFEASLTGPVRGLRIGMLTDLGFGPAVEPAVVTAVQEAAAALALEGATTLDLPPPFETDAYAPIDLVLQVRGRAEFLAFAPDDRARVLPAVAEWCAPAEGLSALDLFAAEALIAQNNQRFLAAQDGLDALLLPTLPMAGFAAELPGPVPGTPLGHTGYTALFNQTGQPAATVGWCLDPRGLPIGVQIAGPRFADRLVLRLAAFLEEARPGFPAWPVLR